ncbi:DUF2914 domain-containing protein [Aggregicoccus sp. 17bor-14]|uniref:DUF2914 domain-containing protein n=1 Tax=Myxococcaceae TaxID=31 RepID=UPI00129D1BE3|nr:MULTISPECIES: DUF2914 domain-containing protein [Myxococcaceae]MBF5042777.1 DUF2914 domain-containing protein [Simulacricoccus sp. 17bor-14]MRI88545.1 DUF2914 domain-containing protein [Aggregicoccus sp. 17bor-14]
MKNELLDSDAPLAQPVSAPTANAVAPVVPAPAVEIDLEDLTPTAKTPTLVDRVQAFRAAHARAEIALFFFAGFAWDVLTLGRIDSAATLLQQGGYLLLLGGLLLLEQRWGNGETPPRLIARVHRFSEDALHFLFGSLLSSYTLFFFKSASGLTAFAFLAVLFLLLLANELPRFRRLGPVVRVGLYSLCVTFYLAYLLPVLVGFLSSWLFAAAVGVGALAVWGLSRFVARWRGRPAALRRVLVPGLGVQALLLGLYFARAIPPVPLAVQDIGIYHGVEKLGAEYRLLHLQPSWKLWHRGDQDFAARAGDRVYCFVRIFAPTRFRDQVYLRWTFEDPRRGWVSHDAIPLTISGGRDEGFRGFAFKQNYQPGHWRVGVETADGRELGRIDFTVRPDESVEPREYGVNRG